MLSDRNYKVFTKYMLRTCNGGAPTSKFAALHKDRSERQSGSALLIVLGMTALLTILVVAFLVTARTEFSTSTFYSHGVNAKLLSETAVNTVIAQISQATKSQDAVTGTTVAWASQPGMIRTYGTDGKPVSFYKLYSADNMATQTFTLTDDLLPGATGYTTWSTHPDLYTDLNEPLNGTFPIIAGFDSNGNPLQSYTTPDDSAKPVKTYESRGDGTPDVEGFWIDPTINPSNYANDPNANPVPMPVKWLYVLQDGTLVPGTSNGATGALVAGSAGKKILGRIAFWTDDETAKININTASEGIFWDVPVCASQDEMNLSANPPAQNEFQRVPGHPATTCLSSVFTDLEYSGGNFLDLHALPVADPATFLSNLSSIYNFTPRISAGGSLGGTYPMSQLVADGYSYDYAPSIGTMLGMTFQRRSHRTEIAFTIMWMKLYFKIRM